MTPRPKLNVPLPWWVWDACQDRAEGRVTWITGGLGGGKSHGGQIWDIQRVLDNAAPKEDAQPTRSWTVAPNYRICETLLELTLKVAQDYFRLREKQHYTVRLSSPQSLDFRPMGLNHRLSFLSADNPKHFVSASLTHWRWSEVGVSKPDTYDKLMDRLRDKRAKVLQGLGDGTPEGLNHYSDLADIPGTGRVRFDAERNFRRFVVETGDNLKNLAPSYLDKLRQRYAYDKSKLLSYEKGLFVPFTKGSAYWEFVASRNIVDPMAAEPSIPLLFWWDFNVTPLAWVVAQDRFVRDSYLAPRRREIVALAESDGDARGLLDGVAEFAARFPVARFRDTPIYVCGDASGWARSHRIAGSDYQMIQQALEQLGYRKVEIHAPKANPLIKQRLEKAAALMAYRLFVVTSDCRRLIGGFTKTSLKQGTWTIEKPPEEDWTHYPDAATYGLYALFRDEDIVNPNSTPVLGIA